MCIEIKATFSCTHSYTLSKGAFLDPEMLPLNRPTLVCATFYHFDIADTCGVCKGPNIICRCTYRCSCQYWVFRDVARLMHAALIALDYDLFGPHDVLPSCLSCHVSCGLQDYRNRVVNDLVKTHTWEEIVELAPWTVLENVAFWEISEHDYEFPWVAQNSDQSPWYPTSDDSSWAGSISEDDFGDDDPLEGLCLGCSDCGTDEYKAHSSDSETGDDEDDGARSGVIEDEKEDLERPEYRSDRHESGSSKHPECAPDKSEDDNSQYEADEYESDSSEYSDDDFWDY